MCTLGVGGQDHTIVQKNPLHLVFYIQGSSFFLRLIEVSFLVPQTQAFLNKLQILTSTFFVFFAMIHGPCQSCAQQLQFFVKPSSLNYSDKHEVPLTYFEKRSTLHAHLHPPPCLLISQNFSTLHPSFISVMHQFFPKNPTLHVY